MIKTMILERFLESLTQALITDIPDDDPTKADIVKIGRFQDDPTRYPISISISPGDPEDPAYRDGIVTLQNGQQSSQNIGFYVDAREIGGGEYWYRRGVLQVQCHFVLSRYPETTALTHAHTVLGRVLYTLENTYVADLTDEFGEHAVVPFVYGNTFFESGGPPADYIWRGKVLWSVLTYRSPIN
jgi:hypothetical protein